MQLLLSKVRMKAAYNSAIHLCRLWANIKADQRQACEGFWEDVWWLLLIWGSTELSLNQPLVMWIALLLKLLCSSAWLWKYSEVIWSRILNLCSCQLGWWDLIFPLTGLVERLIAVHSATFECVAGSSSSVMFLQAEHVHPHASLSLPKSTIV